MIRWSCYSLYSSTILQKYLSCPLVRAYRDVGVFFQRRPLTELLLDPSRRMIARDSLNFYLIQSYTMWRIRLPLYRQTRMWPLLYVSLIIVPPHSKQSLVLLLFERRASPTVVRLIVDGQISACVCECGGGGEGGLCECVHTIRLFLAVAAGVTSLMSSKKEDVIIHSESSCMSKSSRVAAGRGCVLPGHTRTTREHEAHNQPPTRDGLTVVATHHREDRGVSPSEPSHRLDVTRATDSHTRALSTMSSRVAWPAGLRAVPRCT